MNDHLIFSLLLLSSYSYLPHGFRDNQNFWIRLLIRSATNIFPFVSKLRDCGRFNWLDAVPPLPEQPTTHRKPLRSDPTIRWLFCSAMKMYPSPSTTTPVGLLSDMVPFDPVPAMVVAFSSPHRNIWILLFPESATYKSMLTVTKMPLGKLSILEAAPAQPIPATMTSGFIPLLKDLRSTWCRLIWEQ